MMYAFYSFWKAKRLGTCLFLSKNSLKLGPIVIGKVDKKKKKRETKQALMTEQKEKTTKNKSLNL